MVASRRRTSWGDAGRAGATAFYLTRALFFLNKFLNKFLGGVSEMSETRTRSGL